MTVAALAIYGVFALIALDARTLLHVRATGRWPLLLPRSPAGWVGQGALSLGIFGAPAGAVLDLTGLLEQIFDSGTLRGLGLLALSLGVAGVIVAQAQMGRSWPASTPRTQPSS